MNPSVSYSIFPLGDAALTIELGNVIDEKINAEVLQLFNFLKTLCLPYVVDIVPAYSSVTVFYNAIYVLQKGCTTTAFEAVANELTTKIAEKATIPQPQERVLRVPVCYAPAFAPDIQEVAAQTKLSIQEVIQLHTAPTYRVYMIGFLPGFAYMGKVNERIAVPRKAQPRTVIEAGSVGIAGGQTGIYPLPSPGGWQIIGKTPVHLFNKVAAHPVFFRAGDSVIFYSITEDEFKNY